MKLRTPRATEETPIADSPPYPDSVGDIGVEPGRGSTPGTPRWVKVLGIVGLVLVLLIAGLMLFGGGQHGPGRHTQSGDTGGQAPSRQAPSGGDLEGHTRPPGGHR